MAKVPFAAWRPDLPALDNPGTTVAKNVVPLAKSYGPVRAGTVLGTALPAAWQGSFEARDSNGNAHNFAGTATGLYKFNDVTQAWDAVTRSSGAYTTAEENYWRGAQYGDRVIMTNFNDDIQYYDLGTSSVFAALPGSPPKAKYIAVVSNRVVLAYINDSVDGLRPKRVQWSGLDDTEDWGVDPATGADYQDVEKDCGIVTQIVNGAEFTTLLMEKGLVRMDYVGSPTYFNFDKIEAAIGCPAPGSVLSVGALTFYLGEDGFKVFNGAQSLGIGVNKFDRWFLDDLNQFYMEHITGVVDPQNPHIYWSYRSGTTSGTPNKLLIYNYATNEASYAEMSLEGICTYRQQAISVDDLDTYFTSIDDLPASLDSRVYGDRRLLMAGFDTSHKLVLFTGTPLAATIETAEFGGDKVYYCGGVRPLIDADSTIAPTVAVSYRDTPYGSVTTTTATTADADGVCGQHLSSRYMRAVVTIPASEWTHAVGIEPILIPESGR